jgi:phosphocarrier protein HPr
MQTATVTIINKLGLHARAATVLSSTAGRFNSSLKVGVKDKMVNAKSVMSLMLLAASQGSKLQLEADGYDEKEAIQGIVELIDNRFGENE